MCIPPADGELMVLMLNAQVLYVCLLICTQNIQYHQTPYTSSNQLAQNV